MKGRHHKKEMKQSNIFSNMTLGPRILDSFQFLFKNPLIFLIYLPVTLVGLFSVYLSFEDSFSTLISEAYILLMLSLTSFIFTFLVLKTAYFESNKRLSFKHNIDFSVKKFKYLLSAELILVVGLRLFSSFMNIFSLIWLSNFMIAILVVISILFLVLLLKIFLFIPSSVLREDLGFKESWRLTKPSRLLEIGILVASYLIISSILSSILSYIPYFGYLIDSIILGPAMIILTTFLYFDYLRKH